MGKRNRFSSLLTLGSAGIAGYLLLKSATKSHPDFDFQEKVVLITGGSRGLGLVLARKLAVQGAKLALLARSKEELDRAGEELRAYDSDVQLIPCDVRDQNQVEQAVAAVFGRYGRLDVLINNAGVIQVGPLDHMSLDDFREAMDVHFWGPLYTIQSALPVFKKQGGGRIANITSIGGKVAVPHLAPYTASKFALVGLSDALRAELDKNNIQVTTVIPGLMRTGSHVNANFKGRHTLEYAWFSISNALPLASVSVEQAADQILEAIRNGDPTLVISSQARLLILGNETLPDLTAQVMKLVNRLLPGKAGGHGNRALKGWQSRSSLSPSALTQLSDKEVMENNEHTSHEVESI